MQPHPQPLSRRERGAGAGKAEATDCVLAPIRRHASFAAPPDFPGTCSAMHIHARGTAALVHVARQAGHASQVSPTASHRTFHRRLLLQGSPPCHRSGWRSSLPQASARPPPRRLAEGSWFRRPSSAQPPNPAPSGPRSGPDQTSPLRASSGSPLPSGEGLGVRLHLFRCCS
jgi:hypothetical protein